MGIPMKINCVPIRGFNEDEILDFVELTRELPMDVRFIELMPIGEGKAFQGRDKEELLAVIRKVYPDFKETAEKRGNGPAVYGKVPGFAGYVGFIEALHGKFCSSCNRLRLTSEGFLKPCLYYRRGVDLKALLRGGAGEKRTGGGSLPGHSSETGGASFSGEGSGKRGRRNIHGKDRRITYGIHSGSLHQ